MAKMRIPEREIEIEGDYDVVVAGGGVAGIMAALGAARNGASTLLIERYGFLGGTATAGLMTCFNGFRNEHPPDHVQTVRGYAQEFVDRLIDAGGADATTAHGNFGELRKGEAPYAVSFDPEILKLVALEMLKDAGVRILFHAAVSGVVAEGRRVEAAVVETKSGTRAYTGRIFVDATGDGDLSAEAGASFERAKPEGERMMGMTLMYRVSGIPKPGPDDRRLWANGITTIWGPGVLGKDGSDAGDLSEAEVIARRGVLAHLEELRKRFPDAWLVETAAAVGVRETRRIRGLYTITEEDALSGRPQPDSIAVSSNPVPGYYGERRFFEHLGFEIPFRSLVPADLDNVILAGRCISACRPAFQSARSMAPNMAISQAAGTAAAMCVKRGCRPADLDVRALQALLESQGAVVRVPSP